MGCKLFKEELDHSVVMLYTFSQLRYQSIHNAVYKYIFYVDDDKRFKLAKFLNMRVCAIISLLSLFTQRWGRRSWNQETDDWNSQGYCQGEWSCDQDGQESGRSLHRQEDEESELISLILEILGIEVRTNLS